MVPGPAALDHIGVPFLVSISNRVSLSQVTKTLVSPSEVVASLVTGGGAEASPPANFNVSRSPVRTDGLRLCRLQDWDLAWPVGWTKLVVKHSLSWP